MKKLLLILIALMVFPSPPVWAVKVVSLYEAEIPVASQMTDDRKHAVQQGFVQVLIKVSGNPQIVNNPLIKENIPKAEYFVEDLSYAVPSASASEYLLQVRFSQADLNRLLRKAGVSYWGDNRPLILVWLTMTDSNHATEIIGNETQDQVLSAMKQQGKKYGLPLIFPMMDIADVGQVTPSDVSQATLSVLEEAAKRYAPDALLIGNIVSKNKKFESEWRLILDEDEWDWTFSDTSTDNIMSTIVNQVSQILAKHYIAKSTKTASLWLDMEISNVKQRHDLALLLQHLKQLKSIKQIQLSQISGDVVGLSVEVHGSLVALQHNVAFDKHLIAKTQTNRSHKLNYEWAR